MIISVVIPKLQKAQWESIERELDGIEYELIIQRDLKKALSLVTGNFVVFLEEDSGFAEGSISGSLDMFLDNPRYRKLAMISTNVDFDDLPGTYSFIYDEGLQLASAVEGGEDSYPVSVGYFYGSVIRTTAFKKMKLNFTKNTLYRSVQMSDQLWSKGLRVELNPQAIYYSPQGVKPTVEEPYKIGQKAESLKVWNREFIV